MIAAWYLTKSFQREVETIEAELLKGSCGTNNVTVSSPTAIVVRILKDNLPPLLVLTRKMVVRTAGSSNSPTLRLLGLLNLVATTCDEDTKLASVELLPT